MSCMARSSNGERICSLELEIGAVSKANILSDSGEYCLRLLEMVRITSSTCGLPDL